MFLGINPERGSKAEMKGMKQLHVPPRLLKLLSELNNFENPWKIWKETGNQTGTFWAAFSNLFKWTKVLRGCTHVHMEPCLLSFMLAISLNCRSYIWSLILNSKQELNSFLKWTKKCNFTNNARWNSRVALVKHSIRDLLVVNVHNETTIAFVLV